MGWYKSPPHGQGDIFDVAVAFFYAVVVVVIDKDDEVVVSVLVLSQQPTINVWSKSGQ